LRQSTILHRKFHFKFNSINVREYRRGNQEWTIKRHCQHRVHKTRDEDIFFVIWDTVIILHRQFHFKFNSINVREY